MVAWSALSGAGAPAAEPGQTTVTYGQWTVRCVTREALPPCDMLQVVGDSTSGRQVLRLSLAYLGEGDRVGVQAWVPLGVWVSAGVLVQADAETVELPGFGFTRCETTGCFIESVVGEESLEPFKRGAEGMLVVLDSNGTPRRVRLGFSGFTAALGAVKARNRAWLAERARKGEEQ